MIMLIHRICIALSGFGSPRRVERVMRVRAAMLLMKGKGNNYMTLYEDADTDSAVLVELRLA